MSERLSPDWMAWPQTAWLVRAFADAGAPMRFVGGCVRDALLAKPVQDIDAATPLVPEAVMALLERAGIKAIPTGIDHGTVTAVINGKHFEITTLRKDVATDGRHAEVAYTDDWKADAERRDFTINALYLSPQGEMFDYFGGITDAKAGHVHFIGNPEQRIREDYLRILRFFRFYAWYGKGAPDAAALAACSSLATHMSKLSGERVQQEMLKLLAASACHLTVDLMQECEVLPRVLGFGIRDTRMLARFDTLQALQPLPSFLKLMSFVLSSDIPADMALDRLHERFRLSNAMADDLRKALLHYDEMSPDLIDAMQKKLLRRLGTGHFVRVILTGWAHGNDSIAASHPYMAMLKLAEQWHPPELPINGDDLIALGIKPGKYMGQLLRQLEDQWEESDYKLTKEQLLKIAKEKR